MKSPTPRKKPNIESVYKKQVRKIVVYRDGSAPPPGTPVSRLAWGFVAMPEARLAVVVENAMPDVKRAAHYTTKAPGGKGATRELVELILNSKSIWEEMIDKAHA